MAGFKQDKVAYICPIVEWTEADVWEYLGDRPHCSLYDEGMRRIGCVMCPLAPSHMIEHSRRWHKTAKALRRGADAYVSRARRKKFVKGNGRPFSDWCKADSPEDEYWRRWLHTGQTARPIGRCGETDETLCLFAGTGFDERDGNGGEEAEP
jgi:phosphoadenosine phosphosulfate reductase